MKSKIICKKYNPSNVDKWIKFSCEEIKFGDIFKFSSVCPQDKNKNVFIAVSNSEEQGNKGKIRVLPFGLPDSRYYFKNVVNHVNKRDIEEIVEYFMLSYLSRINYLIKNYKEVEDTFLIWFTDIGVEQLRYILNFINSGLFMNDKIIEFLLDCDKMIEEAINQNEVANLMQILTTILLDVKNKLFQYKL